MKIKILQLISSLDVGGTENMLLLLDKKLDKRKFDITVCTIYAGGALEKDFRSAGINLTSLGIKDKLEFPLAIQRFNKLAHSIKPDIIQSFLFPDNLITRLAGKPKGTIVINGKRDVDRYKSPFRIIADIATVGLCDYIISNSKAGIDEWLKRGMDRKKLIYIPNGKDFSYLRVKDSRDSVRKELGLDKNEIAIGIVARLDVQKGHIYLLEALKMVIKERPTIKLFLVGDGPLKRKLQKLCLRLGIKEKVVFLGTRRDVPRLLKAFDIFVLPSLWEGMSGALMEAMAVGLPVIATAVDGNLELIEDGKNGVLAPPKDPISLKQKLMDLIYNPEKSRRLARNATKIIKNYSIKNMVSQYEATFKKVVSKKI